MICAQRCPHLIVLYLYCSPVRHLQAIPAFEEAVAGMKAGGIRRIEVPGDRPELGYPRDRKVCVFGVLESRGIAAAALQSGPLCTRSA